VLDGVAYEPAAAFGLDGEVGLDDLEAIEVYDAATVPAQFSRFGASCGVVLLWTREKSVRSETPGETEPRRPEVQPPAGRAPRKNP